MRIARSQTRARRVRSHGRRSERQFEAQARAAAVGAVAEDDDLFVRGLILTVLPETLVILALLVVLI